MNFALNYPKKILTLLFLLASSLSFCQNPIDEIASESKDYNEFIAKSKAYFAKKYGSKSELMKHLTSKGEKKENEEEYEDNDLTKFQRILHYYNARLTPDGSFFDDRVLYEEAKLRKEKNKTTFSSRIINPNVTWKNIGPATYLGNQVGLGRTSAVAFHPTQENTFYVGAGVGGVWKTTDGGVSYTAIGDLLPTLAVSKIVVNQSNPNIIYVATGGRRNSRSFGVFKTSDDGASWQNTFLNYSVGQNKQIYEMIADPTNSNKMFVAVLSDGLYRTTDGMVTGQRVLAGNVRDVILKPNDPNTVYALLNNGSTGQLMKSIDGGTTFAQVVSFTQPGGDMLLAVSAADPEKIYFTHNNIVEKYTQSGAQFIGTVNLSTANTVDGVQNIDTGSFFISQNNATRLYAGFQSHNRSDSDGANFEIQLNKFLGTVNPDVHVDFMEAFANPLKPDVIYFCNDGGLYEYNEPNNAFTDRNNGLLITQFYDIAVGQDAYDRVSGGSQDNANVYRTPQGNWRYVTPTGDGMGQEIDPSDIGVLYCSYQNGTVIREINGAGAGITQAINTLSGNTDGSNLGEWLTPYLLDPNDPNTIYIGYKRIYKSTNRGNSWQAISPNFTGNNMQALTVAPSNSNYIYALYGGAGYAGDILGDFNNGSANKKFYSTSNGGTSWNTYNFPGSKGSFHIAVDPINPLIVYLGIHGYVAGEKVYKSTNGGQTWTNISGTLPNGPTVAIVALKGGEAGALFVGTDTGVYYKDDTMTDWIEYGSLPHVHVSSLVINYCTKTIFAGTHGRSAFYAPLPAGVTSSCITYCEPTLSTTPVNQKYTTVQILDSNNNVVFTNDTSGNLDVYQQYLDQNISLFKGQTYTLNLTANNLTANSHGAAYFDYNSNTSWADANELIGSFQQTTTATNVTKTITFTVPMTASDLPGRLRLRLLVQGQTIPDACLLNGGQDGNTQDYKILFVDAPNYCAPQVSGTPNEKITLTRILDVNNAPIFSYDSSNQSVLYQNSTNQNITLETGKSYTLEVTFNSFFADNHFAAYMDFNNNLDWEAPNELLGNIQSGGTNQFNITRTIAFTVPANATLTNSSRLRLRYLYVGAVIPDPCVLLAGGFAGETEDYNVTIVSGTLGLTNQTLENSLVVYPNPAKDMLYFKGLETNGIMYKIIDLTGRTVIENTKYNNGISLIGLTKGIYLVQATLDGAKTVKRIIVE